MKLVTLEELPETTTSHNKAGKKKQLIGFQKIKHLHQFGRAILSPGEVATEHFHPNFYEIFYIEEGMGIMKIDGENYEIKKGMCITIEPNELHEVTNNSRKPLTLLYFGIYTD